MTDTLPHSLKAEQALLGMLLFDNYAVEHIPPVFRAEHMFDQVHQRICAAVLEAIQRGGRADPLILAELFEGDDAFAEMGGFGYLADLVDKAPQVGAADYCHVISDMALRREIIRSAQEAIDRAMNDRQTPAMDQIDALERDLYQMATYEGEKGLASLGDVFSEAIEIAAHAFDRDGELSGVSTGLVDLDKKIGGLAPSDLIILAARPSMGKTSLAVNIGENIAKAYAMGEDASGQPVVKSGGVVAVFSLEMSRAQLGIRMLSAGVGISGERIMRGQMSADDFSRMVEYGRETQDAPLYIDDTGAISLEKIATRCRRLKRTVGLHAIIIDYLQLVTISGGEKMQRAQLISEVTAGLKALAKELKVPVLALSQLTRAVESRPDKKPQLSDLKESGAIEQDADVVAFVYRHAYYLEREQPKEGSAEHLKWEEELEKCAKEADVIIGKNRHGTVGSVKLRFNPDTTKFSDTIRDEEFQPRNAA